jgi:hypothetical protein
MFRKVSVLAALIGLASSAAAQQAAPGMPCAPRERMLVLFAEQFGETRRAIGLAGAQAVMELFAADTSGTWTIAVSLPDGRLCILVRGSDYVGGVAAVVPGGRGA